jgi:N6-adenosine-specific RNA methylase IME4
MSTMNIANIKVGKRHRKDLGDIDGLAADIKDIGLLQAVGVTREGRLVWGERRLEACKQLGKTRIPVKVVDIDKIARGEFSENVMRKNFTPSELVAITETIKALERGRAKARQTAPLKRGDKKPVVETFHDGGKTRDKLDKIAAPLGMSGRTLEKARAVVAAAAAQPQRFGKLVEAMDATGRVDRAFKQLKIIRLQEEHAKRTEHGCTVDDLVELAASGKRFSVIYADPPWPFPGSLGAHLSRADHHYNTDLPLDEIMRLPVAPLAADDCALLLWCTGPHITIGTHVEIIKAWGFKPSAMAFVWVKQNKTDDRVRTNGQGCWTTANAEFCFIATKGTPTRLAFDVHQVVLSPVEEHSEKPEAVRVAIGRLFAAPY